MTDEARSSHLLCGRRDTDCSCFEKHRLLATVASVTRCLRS